MSKTMLEIDACVLTHMGKVRTNNEDAACLVKPHDAESLSSHGVLAIVADGMGGHEGGELASAIAMETIARSYYAAGAPPSGALELGLREACRKIYQAACDQPSLKGMGTTCVTVAIREDQAWWAWVGDSRFYLLRAEEIYRMSEDHTVVHELVRRGVLSAEEASQHPDRSILARALGTRKEAEPAVGTHPLQLAPGDRLLLCSDGLHDLLEDAEIASLVHNAEIETAANALLNAALDRGGYDNISLVLLGIRAQSTVPAHPPAITREHVVL